MVTSRSRLKSWCRTYRAVLFTIVVYLVLDLLVAPMVYGIPAQFRKTDIVFTAVLTCWAAVLRQRKGQ
jgi:hypothetical protein